MWGLHQRPNSQQQFSKAVCPRLWQNIWGQHSMCQPAVHFWTLTAFDFRTCVRVVTTELEEVCVPLREVCGNSTGLDQLPTWVHQDTSFSCNSSRNPRSFSRISKVLYFQFHKDTTIYRCEETQWSFFLCAWSWICILEANHLMDPASYLHSSFHKLVHFSKSVIPRLWQWHLRQTGEGNRLPHGDRVPSAGSAL